MKDLILFFLKKKKTSTHLKVESKASSKGYKCHYSLPMWKSEAHAQTFQPSTPVRH